jgi:hypothetical protein
VTVEKIKVKQAELDALSQDLRSKERMITGLVPKLGHIEPSVQSELASRDRQIDNLNAEILELK